MPRGVYDRAEAAKPAKAKPRRRKARPAKADPRDEELGRLRWQVRNLRRTLAMLLAEDL